MEVDVKYLTGV